MPGIFGKDSVDAAIAKTDATTGHVDVEVEKPLDASAELNVEAGVTHDGEHVDIEASGFFKTNFTKAKTAIGAKLGFRW